MASLWRQLILIYSLIIFLDSSPIDQCASTCCTETISSNNQEFLNEILTVIRNRTFFRIFKVNIYKSCALWPDNALCFKPTCSVQECCDDDVPQKFRQMDGGGVHNRPIDLFVSAPFNAWNNIDENQWVQRETNEDAMIYVDLERNPDGYTGYKGEEAGKIWRAIYEAKQLLYRDIDLSQHAMYATEDRVLFRLISGFHTLTSCMVFANMPLNDDSNSNEYGPNLELYERYLHGKDEWIDNLYFGFVFLLRAINKATHVLQSYDYHTGNPSDDAMTMGLINYLLQTDFIQTQCNHLNSFDESTMFKEERFEIMENFRNVFRNISAIIDCVGCEKCKLHAKCEVLGLGTALKILFSKDTLSVDMFERNEILALIVTLGKYSDAIQFIEEMEQQIVINKLKANIQGFVDVDNEIQRKEEEEEEGENMDFMDLIDQTFADIFQNDKYCNEWRAFCKESEKKMNDDKIKGVADKICTLHQQLCLT